MKKSIFYIVVCIILVIIVASVLYNSYFPLPKAIELPLTNEVYSVKIEKDGITALYTDDSGILEIINCFLNAKPTRIMTVNDTPITSEYYTVVFYSNEDRVYTSYIYIKNSKWYIEQPYYGVYELDKELIDFLDEV